MGMETPRGTCEACGKTFAVPELGRAYRCKVCGGVVRAEEGAVAVASGRRRREQEHGAERVGRRGAGRSRKRGNKSAWMGLVGLLIVAGVGYGLYASGMFTKLAGGEPDLVVVTADVASEWRAARIDALADRHHPDGRDAFRSQLEAIATRRGWRDGFPAVVRSEAKILKGSTEAPEEGVCALVFGDEQAATMNWLFDPGRARWSMTDFWITPLPLRPRVDAFRAAWSQSRVEALTPFFRDASGEKMAALVQREAEKGGWATSFPSLGEPIVTGEERASSPLAGILGDSKVESVYPTPGGELLVRWAYRAADDDWFVTGFRFPEMDATR